MGYWAASNISDLQRMTEKSVNKRCYGLGFGLNFRVVALDPNFRKLDIINCANAYQQGTRRVLLLDYDGVDDEPVFAASVTIKHKTCDCSRVLSLYTWV